MWREDAKLAFYSVSDGDGRTYAVTCSNAVAYLDLAPGWYDCWAPSGAAGEHFRWVYLPRTAAAPTPTIAAWPAPTAATNAQTEGTPAAATGGGWAPANASVIRLFVPPTSGKGAARLAILYSAAGPVQLNCTKVL